MAKGTKQRFNPEMWINPAFSKNAYGIFNVKTVVFHSEKEYLH